MASLKEMKTEAPDPVRISMSQGELVIDSSYPTWINPTTKVTTPGVRLRWDEDKPYMTLDLRKADDRATYDRFKSWLAEGTDPRIEGLKVYEIKPGEVAAPWPWWDTSNAEKLFGQVVDGVESMSKFEDRKMLVEQCVKYEKQGKNRKVFIEKLESIDLDVETDDALNPDG